MAESPAFKSQPTNQNTAQPTRFGMVFARLPNVTFWCQNVILPSVSVGYAMSPTPFVDQKLPGEKMEFSPLVTTMLVDEDLQNYREVFQWMSGYSFPKSFTQYQSLGNQLKAAHQAVNKRPQYSDITIQVYNNNWQNTLIWKFVDAFPTSLGELNYSAADSPLTVMVVDVTFDYQYFDIVVVDSSVA